MTVNFRIADADSLNEIKGAGYSKTTDSLKVLSDVLDAIEGSGFATGTDSLKILSDVLDLIRTELTFEHQADVSFSQASPVQNTWYPILDTTAKVRVISLTAVMVATTGETIETRITVDGVSITSSTALSADTNYKLSWNVNVADTMSLTTATYDEYRAFLIEGRSVKVEIRKTTANGTGTISAILRYAKR